MVRCVAPGSYDPVTLGHLDVIERAARLFDEVMVAVMHNPAKAGMFAPAERIALLEGSIVADNVVVQEFSGRLLADVCVDLGATIIVKGLRGSADFTYERPMAHMNRHLSEVETLFLLGDPAFEHVSSSLIKEVATLGGDVAGLVPPAVQQALAAKLESR